MIHQGQNSRILIICAQKRCKRFEIKVFDIPNGMSNTFDIHNGKRFVYLVSLNYNHINKFTSKAS